MLSPEATGWFNLIFPGWQLWGVIGALILIGFVIVGIALVVMMIKSGDAQETDTDDRNQEDDQLLADWKGNHGKK